MYKFNVLKKDEQTGAMIRVGHKVCRNELCPCGSKNKYKRCCGK